MDVLIQATELLFRQVEIPKELLADEEVDLSSITGSKDSKTCCQYILWVAMVAQVQLTF